MRESSENCSMYLLTYVSHRGYPEYWFRKSAKSILKCVDDFMFDKNGEHEEGASFGFSIVTLDRKFENDISVEFKVDEMSWPLHKKFAKLAEKIDKEYGKLPGPSGIHLRICRSCSIFTTEKNCKTCKAETTDVEI